MDTLLHLTKREEYRELNTVADNVHTVLFGSDSLAKLPISELIHQFGLNISACNRSVEGLRVRDAASWLDECVFQLRPNKVLLNFGDAELAAGEADGAALLGDYAALIDAIQSHKGSKVYVISVLGRTPEAEALNAALRGLAEEKKCKYVDVTGGLEMDNPLLSVFRLLSPYMRDERLSLSD